MTLYTHFSTEHAVQQLADVYRILAKIQNEPLITQANQKILSAIEDIQKVSDDVGQRLEERR